MFNCPGPSSEPFYSHVNKQKSCGIENLQNVGIIIQDPSLILFASTDLPRTINGNVPGEENNGGALWRNNGEKAFLVVKRAGAVRLPFSWYICDAVTSSLEIRIMMNGALHSNLFHGIVSFTLPVLWRFCPWAFYSNLKLLSNDAPSQGSGSQTEIADSWLVFLPLTTTGHGLQENLYSKRLNTIYNFFRATTHHKNITWAFLAMWQIHTKTADLFCRGSRKQA